MPLRGPTRFEPVGDGHVSRIDGEIAPLAALAERLFDVRAVDASVIADHAATLYQELGDYDQAESLFRRVLEVRARTLGEAHQSTLASLNNLGEFYRIKGNHAQAGSCLRSALDAQSRTLGKEHPNTLASMNNLALLLIGERDYDQAEPLCRGVLNARESLLGEGHIDVMSSHRSTIWPDCSRLGATTLRPIVFFAVRSKPMNGRSVIKIRIRSPQ